MALTSRRFTGGDEELGKKDDDHRPSQWSTKTGGASAWKSPRRRRIIVGIVAIYLLYLFFKNMPTDLSRVSNPRLPYAPTGSKQTTNLRTPPKGPPSRDEPSEKDKQYYDGPIKFYSFAESLHDSFGAPGPHSDPNVVLFAASSLKSVANIVPLACEMASYGRNQVHFALMGRDDMSIPMIKKVNGINEADCPLGWHDARPDYGPYSTDFRMEVSTRAALAHFNAFGHPNVVIIDDATKEEPFFSRGIDDKSGALGIPAIHIRSDAIENIRWMARLDAHALKGWNDVDIEILIHAQTGSSGSLIRLLKSIEKADYFGSPLPDITVELPADVDVPTLRFLEEFTWPAHLRGQNSNNKLTLRRRLQPRGMTAAEASLRTVEAFYPKSPAKSHVLVLSPQAELSPSYWHYLKFTLLEFKYGGSDRPRNSLQAESGDLLGISLELPSTTLDEKTPLAISSTSGTTKQSLVMYDAPNSNAALYFGDRWAELHNFVSNRLAAQSKYKKPVVRPKLVSEQSPAWLEYLVELSRNRGYSMVYPAFASDPESALVTIHNELYHVPEEFLHKQDDAEAVSSDPADYPFTADPAEPPPSATISKAEPLLAGKSSNIVRLLGLEDMELLPESDSMPVFAFDGKQTTRDARENAVAVYKNEFRVQVGGCASKDSKWASKEALTTNDLFCLGD